MSTNTAGGYEGCELNPLILHLLESILAYWIDMLVVITMGYIMHIAHYRDDGNRSESEQLQLQVELEVACESLSTVHT